MVKYQICKHRCDARNSEEHGTDYTMDVNDQSVCPACRIEQLEAVIDKLPKCWRLEDPDIYVLTEEPYHENSSVIGAFTDKEKAIDAFLQAPNNPPLNNYDLPEEWVLQIFIDGKPGKCLHIHDYSEICSLSPPPEGFAYYYPDPDSRATQLVDPKTFQWGCDETQETKT